MPHTAGAASIDRPFRNNEIKKNHFLKASSADATDVPHDSTYTVIQAAFQYSQYSTVYLRQAIYTHTH